MTDRDATPRISWLDKTGGMTLDTQARKLDTFVEAWADGVISTDEVDAQEARVIALMREIEPQLDDATHARVTELLCEITAYDIMHFLHALHAARPQTRFRG